MAVYTKNWISKRTGKQRRIRLYAVWIGMKQRCRDPNFVFYDGYGGRGIDVCDEWKADFEPFREWMLANGYRKGLTIERIDNDGNYCPENCTLITPKEQMQNQRPRCDSTMVVWNNRRVRLVDLAQRFGISPKNVRTRVQQQGWPLERALKQPVRVHRKRN